ncbi:GspH/FimT family pseudopilin [uncultured Oxalicibacterium sp.]|uniref:GspH/FimT family pseudopilin n=1 Tax=uncultured Oxalicibacterium sp. TaxID=1168540 RepID=UPI0025F68330|nr:GspH/FimT family pseudopilin [uncultured Oxalicibacterium sp.]
MKVRRNRHTGFSATELMVILAILGILIAVAIPSFQYLIRNHRLTTAANALFSAVNLARSEAIHRGTRVDLVPAGDGVSWSNGWIIFVDENDNQRPDGAETVIFRHEALPRDLRITARFTDSKVQYLAFNSSGRSRTNASSQASQSGSWLLESGSHARKVIVNFLGRPRVCNPVTEPATC